MLENQATETDFKPGGFGSLVGTTAVRCAVVSSWFFPRLQITTTARRHDEDGNRAPAADATGGNEKKKGKRAKG
jgi:hypothetical protein